MREFLIDFIIDFVSLTVSISFAINFAALADAAIAEDLAEHHKGENA